VLVGDEHELPYERPPLSKQYMSGEAKRDDAHVHPRDFYGEHSIELVDGVLAVALDTGAHKVGLSDGRSLDYDKLLIATGSTPRRPPIPGADGPGVHTLRTLPDADSLRSAFGGGVRVAVIGAGWIGCEVAASARTLGAEVTLIEQAATPLEGVLGRELGELFAGLHRDHGVTLKTGARVEAIEDGKRVRFADGSTVDCDLVVIGVGIAPATALAEAGGLEVDNGIVTDAQLRTSAPDVFAAGDVANAMHPRYGRRIRVEHWANALNQGIHAGQTMLGSEEPYTKLPYFFTDQYELGMEYTGLHSPTDRVVIKGAPERLTLVAYWLDADDRVTAGMHLNEWDAMEDIQRTVEAGVPGVHA
jgi:3-phenylpropionate/trans-cinnamate dioxygenase ferredoxin reductase subunit